MRFARIGFVTGKDQIPVKREYMKKAPRLFFDRYIKKQNPILIHSIDIGPAAGLLVRLPVDENTARNDLGRLAQIMAMTMDRLIEMDVGILSLPEWAAGHIELPEQMVLGDGSRLMPLLLLDTITKSLKIVHKDLKNAEIVIIAGENGGDKGIFPMVYPNVNHLAVFCGHKSQYNYYQSKAGQVFSDTGLSLKIYGEEAEMLARADVVINFSSGGAGYAYEYKQGAIFIDFFPDAVVATGLSVKRDDLFVINGLAFDIGGSPYSGEDIDMLLYALSGEYRRYVKKGFGADIKEVYKTIKEESIHIKGFCLNEKIMDPIQVSKILFETGIK